MTTVPAATTSTGALATLDEVDRRIAVAERTRDDAQAMGHTDAAAHACDLLADLDEQRRQLTLAVTVLIENSYACGRESTREVQVPPPAPGQDLQEWFDERVNEHTGDGHPCGASEHALYEARIIAAPDRPELVGEHTSWEG